MDPGILDFLLVFVLTILAGAWSTAAGVLLGINPVAVWVASTLGSISFTLVVLFAAGPWRDRLVEKYFPEREGRIEASPIGMILDRWGVPGLALGSIVVGPSLTLAAVLVLGVDRPRFLRWYIPITVVGFAVATAFWVILDG